MSVYSLLLQTEQRSKRIRAEGFIYEEIVSNMYAISIVCIMYKLQWSCEWTRLKRRRGVQLILESICLGPVHSKRSMSQQEIVDEIYAGRIHGLCLVSMTLPVELRSRHNHFPAIFKRKKIERHHIPAFMVEYCEQNNLKLPGQPLLVSSFYCEQQLLDCDYVAFLLGIGYEVTWLECVYEFAVAQPFREFIAERARARAEAVAAGQPLVADMFKLQVNSSVFGQSILRADRYKWTKFVTDQEFYRYYVTDRYLIDALPIHNPVDQQQQHWEVSLRPRRVTRKSPITIGLKILNAAKVHLLRFVLDTLPDYLGDDGFEVMNIDTGAARG